MGQVKNRMCKSEWRDEGMMDRGRNRISMSAKNETLPPPPPLASPLSPPRLALAKKSPRFMKNYKICLPCPWLLGWQRRRLIPSTPLWVSSVLPLCGAAARSEACGCPPWPLRCLWVAPHPCYPETNFRQSKITQSVRLIQLYIRQISCPQRPFPRSFHHFKAIHFSMTTNGLNISSFILRDQVLIIYPALIINIAFQCITLLIYTGKMAEIKI